MSNETTQELTAEQVAFKKKYELFLAETQMSYAAASKVLDVSQNSLKIWFTEKGGKVRKPAQHMMRAVELKIDRLNAANEEIGLYDDLYGLSPNDRAAFLRGKLRNHHVTA